MKLPKDWEKIEIGVQNLESKKSKKPKEPKNCTPVAKVPGGIPEVDPITKCITGYTVGLILM